MMVRSQSFEALSNDLSEKERKSLTRRGKLGNWNILDKASYGVKEKRKVGSLPWDSEKVLNGPLLIIIEEVTQSFIFKGLNEDKQRSIKTEQNKHLSHTAPFPSSPVAPTCYNLSLTQASCEGHPRRFGLARAEPCDMLETLQTFLSFPVLWSYMSIN